MKKQTAKNNIFLANVKQFYNSKIYKKTSSILNETQDISQAISFVGQFTVYHMRQEVITKLLTHKPALTTRQEWEAAPISALD